MSAREIAEVAITASGRPVRALQRGEGPAAVVLLHGGQAGRSPHVGCADLWHPLMAQLDAVPRVVALDLPGCGGTGIRAPGDLLVAESAAVIAAALRELDVEDAVLVAHAEASLPALLLAREPAEDLAVHGVVAIAALGSAPTGDAVINLTLLHPPSPRWSAASQRWALGRLSARVDHVTQEIVETLVAHAGGEPHRAAAEAAADPMFALDREADLVSARGALFAFCRDVAYDVPISLIWGSNDPLAGLDVGQGLFDILSTSRAHLDFNVVNGTGHLPFREDPPAVARLVEPFAVRVLRAAAAA